MSLLSVVEAEPTGGSAPPVVSLSLTGMSYGTAPVLGAIDLTLKRGETVAITGPSGIGKSTLLRIVAGLETTYDGQRQVPARIAAVFQEPTLLPWRTATENLTLVSGVTPGAARQALADVGLATLGDRYPGSLSLGQQRRLSLARAFAARPDLLLMDEPFVSLDPDLADEMMLLFLHLRERQRVTTLLVTHVEAEAERLASRIVRLAGRPATIASEQATKPARACAGGS